MHALEDAHAVLVEQPVEEPLGTDGRVDQLGRLDGGQQRQRTPARNCRSGPATSPGSPSPPGRSGRRRRSGASGRNCAMRPPARQCSVGAAAAGHHHLGDRQPHVGRDLLRLAEIDARDLFQRRRRRAGRCPDSAGCARPGRWSAPGRRCRAAAPAWRCRRQSRRPPLSSSKRA